MWLQKMRLLDDVDGNGKDLGGNVDTQKEEVALLSKNVQLLAASLEELKANQGAVTELLAKVAESGGAPKGEAKEHAEDALESIDLEQMSRRDLVKLILDTVERGVDGKIQGGIAGLNERLDKVTAGFESKNAGDAVEKAASKHEDFYEWVDEMRGVLRDNPTMSVERAYTLAKAENPKKVEQLKAKYDRASKKTTTTFTLFPSVGGGGAEGTGKMTQKDAAAAAFDEVLAKFDIPNTSGLKLG